jgi:phosphoglycerol transferase MdoB-like AlkP superfamily enzyme
LALPFSLVLLFLMMVFQRCMTALGGLIYNRYVGFLVIVWLYTLAVDHLGGMRGGRRFIGQYLEILVLLYLYWYLNAVMRRSRLTSVLAAVPILLAYVGQDIYYLLLGKVFRVAELAEVAELMQVMAFKYQLAVYGLGGLTLLTIVRRLDLQRLPLAVVGMVPMLVIMAWIKIGPQQFVDSFTEVSRTIVNWSDVRPVEANGRFAMLLYREAQRQIALEKTSSHHDRVAYDEEANRRAQWLSANGNRRNVHMVVMEGLVDPTLFSKARYSTDPIHPKYRALVGDAASLSISPIFGGKTSQAEFEVLCGVPAFQELAGVEFNAFSGSAAHCLPGILAKTGYRTTVSNAFDPAFFNAVNAYKGMGFAEAFFPREFSPNPDTYITAGDTTGEIYMFDGVLFSQNIDFVRGHLRDHAEQPLFNYVLTMYGHSPHVLNPEKRPRIIKLIADLEDPQLERVANQFFYRSEAIADYIEGLLAIDPTSLIIIVSDHVPALQGIPTYTKLAYLDNRAESLRLNRLIVVDKGRVVQMPTIHHYDIPALVQTSLTDGGYCQQQACAFTDNPSSPPQQQLHNDYLRLMAHAIE